MRCDFHSAHGNHEGAFFIARPIRGKTNSEFSKSILLKSFGIIDTDHASVFVQIDFSANIEFKAFGKNFFNLIEVHITARRDDFNICALPRFLDRINTHKIIAVFVGESELIGLFTALAGTHHHLVLGLF